MTTLPAFADIAVQMHDHVALVEMRRPPHNFFDAALISGLADIFEALTAADRPYKPPKTLSESLQIMRFMVKDKHIDAELFQLFLDSGVYREYAKQFLKPEQIDDVEPARPATSLHS